MAMADYASFDNGATHDDAFDGAPLIGSGYDLGAGLVTMDGGIGNGGGLVAIRVWRLGMFWERWRRRMTVMTLLTAVDGGFRALFASGWRQDWIACRCKAVSCLTKAVFRVSLIVISAYRAGLCALCVQSW